MSATVEDLQQRLDAIDKAIASGVLTVSHGDTSTTFRSLREMERVRRLLKAELAVAEGGARRRRPGYVYQSGKGL